MIKKEFGSERDHYMGDLLAKVSCLNFIIRSGKALEVLSSEIA